MLRQNIAYIPFLQPRQTVIPVVKPAVGEQRHAGEYAIGNGIGGAGIIIEALRSTVNHTGDGIIDTFQTALIVIAVGSPQVCIMVAVSAGGGSAGGAVQIVILEAGVVPIPIRLPLQLSVFIPIGIFSQRAAAYLQRLHVAEAVIGEVVALGGTAGCTRQGFQHTVGILVGYGAQGAAGLGNAGGCGTARRVVACRYSQPLGIYHAGGQAVHFIRAAGIAVGGGILPPLLHSTQLVIAVRISIGGDNFIRSALGGNRSSQCVAAGIVGHGFRHNSIGCSFQVVIAVVGIREGAVAAGFQAF